ncbi:MAG: Manganese/iron superoxide dismutase [Acidimicrobiia bacterium]|nr:Manganese/iron superoxide dismutase [Acidimicrobiia bacterium]
MTYVLPDLPYDYSALEPHLPAKILELHHDKHHAAYVKGANETLEKLEKARSAKDFASLGGLEKTLAFNLAGHVLHSLQWTNLSPSGGGKPEGPLADAIERDFGSFDAFQGQFTAATTTVQGSGWGVLSWEPLGQRLIIEQVYDHQNNHGQGSVPVFVIDAWEHAFYLKYLNDKAAYVEAVWNIVNWSDVSQRLTAAQASAAKLA